MVSRTWLVMVALVVGCGSGGAGVDANAVDAGRSTVSGSWVLDVHQGGDVSTLPADLTGQTIAAWVPRGDGGFDRIDGSGNVTGRFEIADVPEERVIVQVGPSWFAATAARELDLGSDWGGRTDVQVGSAGTTLQVDVSGMSPWGQLDDLLLSAPSLSFDFPLQYLTAADIPAGSTDLVDLACDWQGFPLIESRDPVSVYQYEAADIDGNTFATPTRMATLDPFDMVGGAATDLTVALAPLAPTGSVHLQWNAPAYAGWADQVHPQAFALWGEAALGLSRPGSDPRALFLYQAPTLVSGNFLTLDPLDHTFAYADPFPADWTRVVYASTTFMFDLDVSAGAGVSLFGDMIYADELSSQGDAPVTVRVSPPGRVSVSAGGTSPHLSWQPPTIGTPTGYDVQVVRLFLNGADGDYDFGATLYTAEPEIDLPPGVLADGEVYIFRVAAVLRPNSDPVTHPFRVSYPFAVAEAWSGTYAP
ncbi:MAG TPA: hypothetical protein VL172_06135 [Kofleriaceae bacterium]|nr:hypothetical protein [Kofleriaceae bacterium]